MPTNCLYWLKRDFRLADNPALTAALSAHGAVAPLFILEPSAVTAPETSAFHLHAQCDAFNDLAGKIQQGGGQIGFAAVEVVQLLDELHGLKPITHLVSHQETGGNRTYQRDLAVAQWCEAHGVDWQEHQQTGVFRGEVNRDRRHKDWKKFMDRPALPVPGDLQKLKIPKEYSDPLDTYTSRPQILEIPISTPPASPPEDIWLPNPAWFGHKTPGPLNPDMFDLPLSEAQQRYVQPVSETAAERTLSTFINYRAVNYSKGMSSPNLAFYHCSRLSVHFAWGTLSVRTAYQCVTTHLLELAETGTVEAKVMARNLRSFLSRLHWHDHFTQRLESEVEMEHRPLNPNFHDLVMENDPGLLQAWSEGKTGFPMVDACMRCMATTGYINFRMRAMLTSTATHLLHLDFRSIDKVMARHYTDYEPGIHLAQLQMQAGLVGINTLRTYSPDKQMLDHDPEAVFVHRWVPELRPFPAKEIEKRDPRVGIGDYPPVVVDRIARARAYKKLLGDLKFRPGGREITEAVFAKHGSRRGPRRKPTAKGSVKE